jgi:hypothetical protein
MAEARPLTGAELRDRGVALDAAARHRLHRAGLIDTEGRGPGRRHELTDEGWAWCADALAAPRPARSGAAGGALTAVLVALRRHLDRTRTPLSEVFRPDPEAAVRAAYAEAAPGPGEWVGLADLRRRLAGVPREEVDAALDRMFGTPGVRLVPEDDQKSLTAQDRAAGVRIGAKDVHLLAIGPPGGEPWDGGRS